jgi:DNA repair exonuclease SbcCD ATPase subunit
VTDLSTVISLLNFLGLGGVGVFLYYLFRGLKERIATLTELTQEQNRTLEAVRGRAEEMDRLSESYKRALLDFEEMGKKLEERRKELIKELEAASQRKDEQLAKFTNLQLEEIELKRQSLERLPELEEKLVAVVQDLESQLRIISPSRVDSDAVTAYYSHLLNAPSSADPVYWKSLLPGLVETSGEARSKAERRLSVLQWLAFNRHSERKEEEEKANGEESTNRA